MLTEAFTEYNVMIETIKQTLKWDCARKSVEFQKNLDDLKNTLLSRTTGMHYYSEAKI
jgi:hypothetical protein